MDDPVFFCSNKTNWTQAHEKNKKRREINNQAKQIQQICLIWKRRISAKSSLSAALIDMFQNT